MLEKDIENLIAAHPKEFFPREEFKLVAQQHTIKKRRLDILFEDKYGRFIIIEVKRGILSREASGQVIEYYGLLKEQFPEKSIELILCANTIPNERKTFLENVGIECKEIPVSQLVNIADKYQYTFLDTKKHESEDLDLSMIQSTDSDSTSDEITTWIFQANPKEYDILNALSDEKLENKIHWYVGQHKNRIKKGHVALIWMSGKESGIYAVAQIMSDPLETEEDEAEKPYWLSTEKDTTSTLRVKLKIVKTMINNPVFRHEVKAEKSLKYLSILRFAQGTNFPVTDDEWAVISGLITSREKNKRWDYLWTDVQDALENLRHNVNQTWKVVWWKQKDYAGPVPLLPELVQQSRLLMSQSL